MKTTVTIGIPAYQSEHNIVPLLTSLLNQTQKNSRIEKILVYVDGCTDHTYKNAKSVKSKKIQIINAKKNHGFAYGLQTMISKNKSQIFIGLNDDIRIDSNSVIEEMVKPFKNKKVGLVGGNIIALPPRSFIGRSIYASYLVFAPLRYGIKKGNTDLTCDGKIFALSQDFAKTLNLKNPKVGNVDIFLYYENLKQGRLYKFAKKAEVKFRLPEEIADFKSQESRARISRKLMSSQFGESFLENHKIPKRRYLLSALKTFIKYPLETVFFKLLVNNYLSTNKKSYMKWKLALTTKKLAFLFAEMSGY